MMTDRERGLSGTSKQMISSRYNRETSPSSRNISPGGTPQRYTVRTVLVMRDWSTLFRKAASLYVGQEWTCLISTSYCVPTCVLLSAVSISVGALLYVYCDCCRDLT